MCFVLFAYGTLNVAAFSLLLVRGQHPGKYGAVVFPLEPVGKISLLFNSDK